MIVGLVRNFTARHPEGMTRVLLLGDPSRELGSLAEPECRRIAAALDLAARARAARSTGSPLSAGAKISTDSGTENMDWIALVLRRIIEFTQAGGEINVVVNGINVGAQPYWNAEATMLMHTRGILVMMPESAMVLTGKRALDFSGGVSAEDNQGIGGYERVMGPNGQAQYFARDIGEACQHPVPAPRPRVRRARRALPAAGGDARSRWTATCARSRTSARGRARLRDGRRRAHRRRQPGPQEALRHPQRSCRPWSTRTTPPLERWSAWRDAETVVVWDAHLGGWPVCLARHRERAARAAGDPARRRPGAVDGRHALPAVLAQGGARDQRGERQPAASWCSRTSPASTARPSRCGSWQLEYGAEIGRAVVNFDGPIVFCVVSRYHGGAFVVFSNALHDNFQVVALEGTYASVIGGAPAAAVVFSREVDKRTAADPRVTELEARARDGRGPGEGAAARARCAR